MPKKTNTTIDLIAQLSEEHGPVKPIGCAYKRAFIILSIIITYNIIAVYFENMRHDVSTLLSNGHILFELVLSFSIGVSAIFASALLMIPDMRGQKWLLSVPTTLMGVFLTWVLISFLDKGYEAEYAKINGACFMDGMIYAAIPTLLIILLSKKGASTHRMWQTLMATLAVVPFGWISLRFVCSVDNPSHIFLDHVFPFVLIGLGLGLFSRRLFSW